MRLMATVTNTVLQSGESRPLQSKRESSPCAGLRVRGIGWLGFPASITSKAVNVIVLAVFCPLAVASGSLVMSGGTCTMHIDFYSARFSAYQPDTRGSDEFCENLPDTGPTIVVLDYLHPSLKEVPVDFRIIRDVTGQGRFAKLEDVEALGDIQPLTEFYQPPLIRPDGSFKIEYDFKYAGHYIGVVTAGHPTTEKTYAAVFPFSVGIRSYRRWMALAMLLAGSLFYFWRRHRAAASAD